MSEYDNGLTLDAARQCIESLRAECEALSAALDAHDLIWRAKSWLVRDMALTPDEAHDLIWRESNNTNTRVADIARRIISEHEAEC